MIPFDCNNSDRRVDQQVSVIHVLLLFNLISIGILDRMATGTERFTDGLFLLSGILVNLAAMVSARPKLGMKAIVPIY